MAQTSSLEVVRRLFDLHHARNAAGVAALLHDDVVVTGVARGRTYAGKEEVCRYLADQRADGPRTDIDAQRIVEDGDAVVVHGRIRVHDGAGFADSPAAWRVVIEDGLVRRIDALRASAFLPSAP